MVPEIQPQSWLADRYHRRIVPMSPVATHAQVLQETLHFLVGYLCGGYVEKVNYLLGYPVNIPWFLAFQTEHVVGVKIVGFRKFVATSVKAVPCFHAILAVKQA